MMTWLRVAPPEARRALLAASLGWALDAFDVLLFSLLLPSVIAALGLSKARAGALGSITLVAAAAGGVLFGVAADRFGRARMLSVCVLLYAVFTAACGLAWSFASLACFRVLLGVGMGGEWATGASLVAEVWPAESRDKALALMQSSFAAGFAMAALVSFMLLPRVGWRGVFFFGLAPAVLTFWLRRSVREPAAWQTARAAERVAEQRAVWRRGERTRAASATRLGELFRRPLLRPTLALTTMNAFCLFAWWGFNLWVPAYLSLPASRGGVGFSARWMTAIVVVTQVGMWFGYVSFGYLATAFGRRRVYVTFLLSAAALLVVYARVRSPLVLLALGPCLAFAATGYFSGFAAVTAEIYPTRVRSTAQGLTYNLGRLASAAAPFAAGTLAERHGFAAAFYVDALAFVLAAAVWVFLR